MQGKTGTETEGKAIQLLAPLGIHPIHRDLNPDTITDTMLCLQTGALHGCPLRGSTSSWLRQIRILTANHWTEVGAPMEELGEGLKELKGMAIP